MSVSHGITSTVSANVPMKVKSFTILGKNIRCSCPNHFTKKRPLKIFKIENFNRQAIDKITLILPNLAPVYAGTLS